MTSVHINKNEVFVDGIDISHTVKRIEMLMSSEVEENQIAIFVSNMDPKIEFEGVVTLVEPPKPAESMRMAVGFIESMDAKKIEERALEGQTMGSPKSMTTGIMDAIMEVFEDAADGLESSEEVRGGADDGHDPSSAPAAD